LTLIAYFAGFILLAIAGSIWQTKNYQTEGGDDMMKEEEGGEKEDNFYRFV